MRHRNNVNWRWRVQLLVCVLTGFWEKLIKISFLLNFTSNPNKMANINVVLNKFYDEYVINTPKKLKIIDAYLFYIVLTGVIQFIYCCLVGSFPFNSFLSGFISTVSCFILGGNRLLLSHTWEIEVNKIHYVSQFAFVYKPTHKINCNLLGFHQREDLPISFWPTLYYTLS